MQSIFEETANAVRVSTNVEDKRERSRLRGLSTNRPFTPSCMVAGGQELPANAFEGEEGLMGLLPNGFASWNRTDKRNGGFRPRKNPRNNAVIPVVFPPGAHAVSRRLRSTGLRRQRDGPGGGVRRLAPPVGRAQDIRHVSQLLGSRVRRPRDRRRPRFASDRSCRASRRSRASCSRSRRTWIPSTATASPSCASARAS